MVEYDIIRKRANDLLYPSGDSKLTQYREAYAWYCNNKDAIKLQIQDSLYRSIIKQKRKIYNKIKRYPYINKIPKALTRLCNLYKDTPDRWVRVDGQIDRELTAQYNNRIVECDLDMVMNDNYRLAMFYNTILVGPYFENGKLYLRTYLPFEYVVIPNDNDKSRMEAVLLLNKRETSPNVFEQFVVVWTKEQHYIITSTLDSDVVVGNEEKINPYGVIPFVVLRMRRDSYDFQGNGLEWMIETCLSASVNLTYANFMLPYNIGGILIAKNLPRPNPKNQPIPGEDVQVNKKDVNMTGETEATIEVSPDSILSLREEYNGKDASLEFLNLESDLSVVRAEAEWLTRNSLSDVGVDLNSIITERGYTSGFGIVAESVGLMELRKEHIPVLAKFERDLFNMIRILLRQENEIAEYYPDDAELIIDYQEPSFPRTVEEIRADREMKLKLNSINYLDIIKEDNPGILDNEMALHKLEENYRINKRYGGMNSFDQIVEIRE